MPTPRHYGADRTTISIAIIKTASDILKNRMAKNIICLVLCLLNISVLSCYAQSNSFNIRDDQYPLLGLKRAKEAYEYSRAEYERKQKLYDEKLISQQELEYAFNIFSDAEVNYQQSLLAALFEQQYVSVVRAVKYQATDGRKHVKLTLANTSGGGADFKQLVALDEELFQTLQPEIINDVYASLLNDSSTTISQPYEAKIEQLKYGQPVEVDFTLLQDLDAVTVNLIFGHGSQRQVKIFLQKDETVDKVMVQSGQFSQEAELGGTASYDLTLELFSGTTNTYRLAIINLPSQINHYFIDPVSQARLRLFRFTEQTNTCNAVLKIFLPERPSEQIIMDQPLSFYVLVIPRTDSFPEDILDQQSLTQNEIEELEVGFIRLELVPRGVGRLLVKAPQLYHAIQSGQDASAIIHLYNDGSRRLDNIEIDVDTPLGWDKTIDPNGIRELMIGEEKKLLLRFTPPDNVPVGRYECRIKTYSLADEKPVYGEEKTMTIEVKPKPNVLLTLLFVLFILGIVVSIVVFGIRLSRK